MFMQKKGLEMTSIEKVPKFSGNKSDFLMFAAKAKAYLAMKFLSAMLSANFKKSLPANDEVKLDLNKPKGLIRVRYNAQCQHHHKICTKFAGNLHCFDGPSSTGTPHSADIK